MKCRVILLQIISQNICFPDNRLLSKKNNRPATAKQLLAFTGGQSLLYRCSVLPVILVPAKKSSRIFVHGFLCTASRFYFHYYTLYHIIHIFNRPFHISCIFLMICHISIWFYPNSALATLTGTAVFFTLSLTSFFLSSSFFMMDALSFAVSLPLLFSACLASYAEAFSKTLSSAS